MPKSYFAVLFLVAFVVFSLTGGCIADSPVREETPAGSRGPLHYQGPEVREPDLVPPEEDAVTEDAEEEDEEADLHDDDAIDDGDEYYSILDWLPFEDDNGQDQSSEQETEESPAEGYTDDDLFDPDLVPENDEGYSL